MIKTLSNSDFAAAFAQCDYFMTQHQALWRFDAFVCDSLPWQQQHQQLYQSLLALDDGELDTLTNEPTLNAFMAQFIASFAQVQWQLPELVTQPVSLGKFADVGIPGRKKQQIEYFSALFSQLKTAPKSMVDWCSGKGYLAGHLASVLNCAVSCLEYDKRLCQLGHERIAKQGLAPKDIAPKDIAPKELARQELAKQKPQVAFLEQDVLKPVNKLVLQQDCHSALHACGELHLSLIKQVSSSGSALVVSPCCYHLIQADIYQPLSAIAQGSALQLSRTDLRLSVLQTATASKRVQRLRQQELLWRIGFDLWRRQVTGRDEYTPMASFAKKCLSGSFTEFCQQMALSCQLELIAFDADKLLEMAQLKLAKVERLSKARLAFRPIMELWLLLDRALYLCQQGYSVQLGQFCPAPLTPRNAVLIAQKNS